MFSRASSAGYILVRSSEFHNRMSYWMEKESQAATSERQVGETGCRSLSWGGFSHGSCSTHSCQEHTHTAGQEALETFQCPAMCHKSRTCFSPVSCKTFCGSTQLISLLSPWVQAYLCHTHLSQGAKMRFSS